MNREVRLSNQLVGDSHPTYIVAEIGINHNGSLELAKRLIDAAERAGCNAVKFQKRSPESCVPNNQRDLTRETPWGLMTYLEYRQRLEFGFEEFEQIDIYSKAKGIPWFASCWDVESVDFIEQFDPPCYKISSACLTDSALRKRVLATGKPVILSTGMSTLEQIATAVETFTDRDLIINHCTSAYPCDSSELNLRMIETLRSRFDRLVGYSGHESGLVTTVAAVVLGACLVERHISLDRAMWGSDQAASVEPHGFERLVKYIRVVEQALGNGQKQVYASELPLMERLRAVGS